MSGDILSEPFFLVCKYNEENGKVFGIKDAAQGHQKLAILAMIKSLGDVGGVLGGDRAEGYWLFY